MSTAPVKAIVLPAVYRANLECQSHVPLQHAFSAFAHARYRFTHAWTPRVLHFSAFIYMCDLSQLAELPQ